ncbi:hypothetical protein GCM10007881_07810 [Mesorhizobium huakuii]|uniref:hypothetical protein n=1 Tax=Mesorhizobium huakuii TaxID=28104 RepID=UPI00235C616C|nr:hypothetical protein [Mesorhizobium huakuii]GLQ77265.1 hypothetical protein GCM10007881_07810 [Mesorhizobium huakuii]
MIDDLAESALRKYTNDLMKRSFVSDLPKIQADIDKFIAEYSETYPNYIVYARRRGNDIKRMFYLEKMSETEAYELYLDYMNLGFDDLGYEIGVVWWFYRATNDAIKKQEYENHILRVISSNFDSEEIREEVQLMPDLVEKAKVLKNRST